MTNRPKGYQPFTDLLNEEVAKLVAAGATISEIAGGIGVTQQQLKDWRECRGAPALVTFLKACQFFGWPYPTQLRAERPAWFRDATGEEYSWIRQTGHDLGLSLAGAGVG